MKKIVLCLSLLALCACDNSRYAYDDAYWGTGGGDYVDEGYYNRSHWDENYEHREGYRNGDPGNRGEGTRGSREGSRGGEGGHMGGSGHGGGHR
jgi:hypothetical protein